MKAYRISAPVVLVAALLAGCGGEVKLGVVSGVDACNRCNMVIDQVNQACGIVDEGSLTVYDSPGCLLSDYDKRRGQEAALPDGVFFADYRDSSWHAADSTTFLLTTHIPTVMNAGVICFSSNEAAEAMRRHPDEVVTDWLGYRTARGTPDLVLEVTIAADAMVPEVVEAAKGDLVLWRVHGSDLETDLEIEVMGYPEAGTITVPADGETVEFRIMTTRPGAGFPITPISGGEALGMMKVTGTHTTDEESM